MTATIDADGIRRLFPVRDRITDAKLRQAVLDIRIEIGAYCAWERFEDVPKGKAFMLRREIQRSSAPDMMPSGHPACDTPACSA